MRRENIHSQPVPRAAKQASPDLHPRPIEVCILAGGQSVRMGRDKARVRLAGRSLLGHARAAARSLGLSVRVIRRDLVPRCGPLGGIFTALTTTRAAAVLFLSCDMPFITPALLLRTIQANRTKSAKSLAVFTVSDEGAGFPFLIQCEALPRVEGQIRRVEFSLQSLARVLHAKRLRLPCVAAVQLTNLNTPAELTAARRSGVSAAHLRLSKRAGSCSNPTR